MNSPKPVIGSAIVLVCLVVLGLCAQQSNASADLVCCSQTLD